MNPRQSHVRQRHQDVEQVHLLLKDIAGVYRSHATEVDRLTNDCCEPEHATKSDIQQAHYAEREVGDRQLRPCAICSGLAFTFGSSTLVEGFLLAFGE
jgi:hypothetical protein